MKTNRLPIWIFPALMLVMVALVAIMPKSQDTRRGAYFAGTDLSLYPNEIGVTSGDEFPVRLMVRTQNVVGADQLAKVDFVETEMCYEWAKMGIEGDSLAIGNTVVDLSSSANLSVGSSFTSIVVADVSAVQGNKKCLHLIVKAEKPKDKLGSGFVHVATIKFRGVAAGIGTISLEKSASRVGGYNPDPDGTDAAIEIGAVVGATCTVQARDVATTQKWGHAAGTCNETTGEWSCTLSASGTFDNESLCRNDVNCSVTETTVWPVLNYRVAFAGVRPTAETECANWKLSVVVKKGDVTRTYESTPVVDGAVSDGATGQFRAFKGSVVLTDFSDISGLAVFMKGPKHLQVKYGKVDQTSFYNQAGGEVTVTRDVATSPIYNWTGYPIIACDIVGDSATTAPNGVCNMVDYSVVKTASLANRTVAAGETLLEDLDGNCKTNVVDLNWLMQAMKERLSQLY